jgi:hypothetical protein
MYCTDQSSAMNSSIRLADTTMHIKIVVVSLFAAILVVIVGITARDFAIEESPAATKAAQPANLSANRLRPCVDRASRSELHTKIRCQEAES